jgi:hypothetical protein
MASEIKANKISPATGTAFTIGDSGDTFTLPSGATLAVASGATISNAGTASGFADALVAFDANKSGVSTGGISKATWTKIPLDTANVDTESAFASNKFTVPSGKGGKYFLYGCFSGTEVAGWTTALSAAIYVNGVSVADNGFNFFQNSIIDQKLTTATVSMIISLADADYVELYGYIDTNGTTPIYYNNRTRLTGHRLGD